jgi:hypothetical protein
VRNRAHALLVAIAAAEFLTAAVFVFAGLYVSALSFVFVGFLVLVALRMERLAYVAGYLRGRSAMIAAFGEAYERGLTLEEWLTAESERDAAVIAAARPRRLRRRRR